MGVTCHKIGEKEDTNETSGQHAHLYKENMIKVLLYREGIAGSSLLKDHYNSARRAQKLLSKKPVEACSHTGQIAGVHMCTSDHAVVIIHWVRCSTYAHSTVHVHNIRCSHDIMACHGVQSPLSTPLVVGIYTQETKALLGAQRNFGASF